jgi:hypothetical protein
MDWTNLAHKLGASHSDFQAGRHFLGQLAIAELLGPDIIRDAVDVYVNRIEGSEPARSVLSMLRLIQR